jgi:hypothetical protein
VRGIAEDPPRAIGLAEGLASTYQWFLEHQGR